MNGWIMDELDVLPTNIRIVGDRCVYVIDVCT